MEISGLQTGGKRVIPVGEEGQTTAPLGARALYLTLHGRIDETHRIFSTITGKGEMEF